MLQPFLETNPKLCEIAFMDVSAVTVYNDVRKAPPEYIGWCIRIMQGVKFSTWQATTR